jgi:hypothetical protein
VAWQIFFECRNQLRKPADFFVFLVWVYVVTAKKLKTSRVAFAPVVCECHKLPDAHIGDILEKWCHFGTFLNKIIP